MPIKSNTIIIEYYIQNGMYLYSTYVLYIDRHM